VIVTEEVADESAI